MTFKIQGALLTFAVLKIVFCTLEETCEKIDPCSCRMSNGSVVSLKAVDGKSKPSFTGIRGTSGRTFDWNPCTPFSEIGCDNVLLSFKRVPYECACEVCQVAGFSGYPAGSQDTSFSVDSSGNVVISYGTITGPDDYRRGSNITLKCDPSQPGKGIIPNFTAAHVSSTTSIYSATFTSKYACATGGDIWEMLY